MNKNSDRYELSVWIFNILKMNRRFLCQCYLQGSGSHEIAFILLEIVSRVALHLSTGKAQKSRRVKKASKWIEDVHILQQRHWKVLIL